MNRFLGHWRTAAAAAVAGLLLAGAALSWEVTRGVRLARAGVESESQVAFALQPLERIAPAGIHVIGAAPSFRDAAVFNGHLFVAGPHGLLEYDAAGAIVRRLRPGLELPPVEVVALAAGVLAARPEPELLIGTAGEGLLIFDGRSVRQMRPRDPGQRKLTALLFVGGGRILLGTEKSGLFVFDGRHLTLAHPGLASVPITALAGSDGDVWIGTVDRGVLHWRAGEIEHTDESGGLPDARVLSLSVNGDRAYAGTAVGVAEFGNGKYVRSLAPGLFASAVAVRRETLIVGTLDESIAQIPLAARTPRAGRPIVQDAPGPIHRFVDVEGVLYALTDEGVYSVDDRSLGLHRAIGAETGQLTDRNVSALALDAGNRLWVGYFDRGLDVLDADGRRTSHIENDRVFCVNRIVHDAAGGLTAVATANGLALFDPAAVQRQVLGRAEGLIADHVTDVMVDRDRMTVATPAGLTFIDPEGSRSMYAFHGLVNNHVYALAGSGTRILVGTLGGASVLEDGIVRASYTNVNSGLTHNWITAAARVDEDWFVGTYGGGVFRLDVHGAWRRFPDLAGPIEINPNAMAVTPERVFAGTLSKGLLVYDRQTLRWTIFDTGLPSVNVTALAAGSGALYVGTDNGIVRVDEEAFRRP